MSTSFAGGCACGAIRYQCAAPPLAMYNCHCLACQHASGAGYSPLVVVPTTAVRIEGAPKYYAARIDSSSHAHSGFCPECGSLLFAKNEQKPEVLMIRAGTLDNASWYKPIADIWTTSAQPWVCMDRHIPKVFKSPPVLEKDDAVTT